MTVVIVINDSNDGVAGMLLPHGLEAFSNGFIITAIVFRLVLSTESGNIFMVNSIDAFATLLGLLHMFQEIQYEQSLLEWPPGTKAPVVGMMAATDFRE